MEDSALVVSALRILLEDAGHRVSDAGSVRAALDIARSDRPEVMLLDLALPDGDGLSVLETLSNDGLAPRVTVAVTGRDEPHIIARCKRLGCREVLVKPIRAMALPTQVAEWLAE
ncbi:MAG: response regulator [Anaerolineae bacterium]|nr:response regulator [Gemmatimonadaceae bacterium]